MSATFQIWPSADTAVSDRRMCQTGIGRGDCAPSTTHDQATQETINLRHHARDPPNNGVFSLAFSLTQLTSRAVCRTAEHLACTPFMERGEGTRLSELRLADILRVQTRQRDTLPASRLAASVTVS